MRSRRLMLCAVSVVFVCVVVLVNGCSLKPPKAGDRIAEVSVPKTPPPNSIIFFKFRPHGDPDAKFYGAGFATALRERTYCPHSSLTLRGSIETTNDPGDRRLKRAQQWSREAALRQVKAAGVRYVLTGDVKLIGDRISLSAELFDVTTGSRRADFKASGRLSDLPSMQVSMAQQVVRAMGLKPDAEQSKTLGQPTFAKPETVLLCGKSHLADDDDQACEFAWQAWERDPGSELAAANVLGCYFSRRGGYRDIRKDKRLSAFVESVSRRFPTSLDINSKIADLYADQYQFKKAEMLARAVVRADPRFEHGHSLLGYVAEWRQDADLAVKEARSSVEAWPTSPFVHVALADAYELAAGNARRGHAIKDLSRGTRRSWGENSRAAFDEAAIAVRLNPDYAAAWRVIMRTSLDLGWSGYAERAFREMVRVNPKDRAAYLDYATGIARGMSASKRLDEVLALADKNLGPGSADACLVRGWVLLAGSPSTKQYEEALNLADRMPMKSKKSQSSALDLKVHALKGLGRMQEALEIAKKGFEMDPSPSWRTLLAAAYTHGWTQSHDPAALRKAVELMTIYADEIPFDSYGHSCLGWCLGRQGLREEANKQFAWALALDPRDRCAKAALSQVRHGLFD